MGAPPGAAAAAALVASVGLGFVKGWGTREREMPFQLGWLADWASAATSPR